MTVKSKGQIPARRKSRRQPRPAAISKSSSPPLPPLPESDLDTFFESGPFSALCQGATGAEVAEDFELLRAAIEEMGIILLTSSILSSAATSKAPALVRGAPGNWGASVASCALSASGTGTRKPPRIRVQKPPAEPAEPLTPQSLNEEPFINDSAGTPVHDIKKHTSAVAPRSFYAQLEESADELLRTTIG